MTQRQITELRFQQWSERICQSSQQLAVGMTQSKGGGQILEAEKVTSGKSTRSRPVSMAAEAEVLLGHNSAVFL